MDARIFDSAMSHTRLLDAFEKKRRKSVSICGRFRLWTSFESSPVTVKIGQMLTIRCLFRSVVNSVTCLYRVVDISA